MAMDPIWAVVLGHLFAGGLVATMIEWKGSPCTDTDGDGLRAQVLPVEYTSAPAKPPTLPARNRSRVPAMSATSPYRIATPDKTSSPSPEAARLVSSRITGPPGYGRSRGGRVSYHGVDRAADFETAKVAISEPAPCAHITLPQS